VDSIFQAIFTTLRDDATLQSLVGAGGAARFKRSWPNEEIKTSATNPALVIVALSGTSGKDPGEAQRIREPRIQIDVFVRHDGFGQTRLLQIRDRIDFLLNLYNKNTASMRALNLTSQGEQLDLFETQSDTHHGVLSYASRDWIPA
jgi:hypothetical protein